MILWIAHKNHSLFSSLKMQKPFSDQAGLFSASECTLLTGLCPVTHTPSFAVPKDRCPPAQAQAEGAPLLREEGAENTSQRR